MRRAKAVAEVHEVVAIHRRLRKEERKARMLLTVHDELVFEVPPEEFEAVAALVREEMTTPLEKQLKLEVPLKVDMASGPNWLDVEEVVLRPKEPKGKKRAISAGR